MQCWRRWATSSLLPRFLRQARTTCNGRSTATYSPLHGRAHVCAGTQGLWGTYVLLQGPLAFEVHPEFGTDLISIATAAQHMLFRVLAKEADESAARVVELVSHAFIRDLQTQPGSALSGEAVGAYAAYLLSGAGEKVHGQSIELRSLEQLTEVGLDTENL